MLLFIDCNDKYDERKKIEKRKKQLKKKMSEVGFEPGPRRWEVYYFVTELGYSPFIIHMSGKQDTCMTFWPCKFSMILTSDYKNRTLISREFISLQHISRTKNFDQE